MTAENCAPFERGKAVDVEDGRFEFLQMRAFAVGDEPLAFDMPQQTNVCTAVKCKKRQSSAFDKLKKLWQDFVDRNKSTLIGIAVILVSSITLSFCPVVYYGIIVQMNNYIKSSLFMLGVHIGAIALIAICPFFLDWSARREDQQRRKQKMEYFKTQIRLAQNS